MRWRNKQKLGFSFIREPKAELEVEGVQSVSEDSPCKAQWACISDEANIRIGLPGASGGQRYCPHLPHLSPGGQSSPRQPGERVFLRWEDRCPDPGSYLKFSTPVARCPWLGMRAFGGEEGTEPILWVTKQVWQA